MTKSLATFEPHRRPLDDVWVVRAVSDETRGAVVVLETDGEGEAQAWASVFNGVGPGK